MLRIGDGADVTGAFLQGARRCAELARHAGVRRAILKARSPSCGVAAHQGTQGLVPGPGVAAAALLSITLRLGDSQVDCNAGRWLHNVEAVLRIVSGVISGLFWFLLKMYALVFAVVWIRWTFPRTQFYGLLNLSWKILIPVSLFTLLLSSAMMKIL